jgi:hypothetical protein
MHALERRDVGLNLHLHLAKPHACGLPRRPDLLQIYRHNVVK